MGEESPQQSLQWCVQQLLNEQSDFRGLQVQLNDVENNLSSLAALADHEAT